MWYPSLERLCKTDRKIHSLNPYNCYTRFATTYLPIALAKRRIIPGGYYLSQNGVNGLVRKIWKAKKNSKFIDRISPVFKRTLCRMRAGLGNLATKKGMTDAEIQAYLQPRLTSILAYAEVLLSEYSGEEIFFNPIQLTPTPEMSELIESLNPDHSFPLQPVNYEKLPEPPPLKDEERYIIRKKGQGSSSRSRNTSDEDESDFAPNSDTNSVQENQVPIHGEVSASINSSGRVGDVSGDVTNLIVPAEPVGNRNKDNSAKEREKRDGAEISSRSNVAEDDMVVDRSSVEAHGQVMTDQGSVAVQGGVMMNFNRTDENNRQASNSTQSSQVGEKNKRQAGRERRGKIGSERGSERVDELRKSKRQRGLAADEVKRVSIMAKKKTRRGITV